MIIMINNNSIRKNIYIYNNYNNICKYLTLHQPETRPLAFSFACNSSVYICSTRD